MKFQPDFKNADKAYRDIIWQVIQEGEIRETRSGTVKTVFAPQEFRYSMRDGTQPLLTGKKIFTQQMIGELLWFISGGHSLSQLMMHTWGWNGITAERKTIWTPDQQRWLKTLSPDIVGRLAYLDDCGRIYGRQWRNSAGKYGCEVDQLEKLLRTLQSDPDSRYHLVNSWNAAEIDANMMALPPCHVMFQCFVSNDNELSLKWYQRSVDCFLGLPFNIASYGLLLSFLCKLTGYTEGDLIGTFGDTHIYHNHISAVHEYLNADTFPAPTLILPELTSIEQLSKMTALDFKDCYQNYQSSEAIKAPLSVGA
ncbi:thymidylate synthase [Pectobacterium phage Arno162]|uniref:thymidylate synthase n=1 Tax=Pectobacterium phage Arno162 TaxID=2500577 RepID=A0A678ZXA0_9CAUD|nr:thymidylate synthase [Pectobacterium phage Arno162]